MTFSANTSENLDAQIETLLKDPKKRITRKSYQVIELSNNQLKYFAFLEYKELKKLPFEVER